MANSFTMNDMDLVSIRRYLDPADAERMKLAEYVGEGTDVKMYLHGDRTQVMAEAEKLAALCRSLGAASVELDETNLS